MILDSFINDIKYLVSSAEVKYSKRAKENETLESLKASDLFIGAYYETDTFGFYGSFDRNVLINSGMSSQQYDIDAMVNDKNKIPLEKRSRVIAEQRKYILNNYEELNEYYRPYVGLPPLTSTEDDFVIISDDIKAKYFIDPSKKYIHTLDDNELYLLKIDGYLDKVILENPDKKYLRFMGEDKLNIIKIREAKNFEIIYADRHVDDPEYIEFMNIYDTCREYMNTVIYNSGFASSYKYYDNFIALSIMAMTIQKMTAKTFKYGIQRDLYDWDFVRAIYSLYNIPFVEDLGMEYHQIIIKNLNNLLRYKATDKVLFDICSLLGHDRIKIYKYYLMKHRKYDHGKPLFAYKKIVDDDGNVTYVEDLEKMYDIYFQQVNLKDENLTLALKDKESKLDYLDVTMPDPYWVEDDTLYKTLYEKEYNYVESKYIGLTIMYKFTELIFELTYAFRLVQDKKDELSDAIIMMPKIDMDYKFTIFEIAIYLIALICKRNGFKDFTITDPSKISHIYGFDFNESSISKIKDIILSNKKLVDQKTLEYFTNLEVSTATDVNDMFVRIREYNDFILEKMRSAKTVKEYHLYKDIFTISMASEVTKDAFTVNGKTHTSYLEYLDATCPMLSAMVRRAESNEEIAEQISYVISRLEYELEGLQYLYAVNDNNSPLILSLMELIRFFKSYTVDLATFGVIYLMDSKYYNMLRIIDDYRMYKTLIPDDNINIDYDDSLKSLSAWLDGFTTDINIDERYKMLVKLSLVEKDIFEDYITDVHKDMWMEMNLGVFDDLILTTSMETGDSLNIRAVHDIESKHFNSEKIELEDRIELFKKILLSQIMKSNERLSSIKEMYGTSMIHPSDKYNESNVEIIGQSDIDFCHTIDLTKNEFIDDNIMAPYDYMLKSSKLQSKDRVFGRDTIKLYYE